MGTDIHMISQTRDPDGSWTSAAVTMSCSWCSGTGKDRVGRCSGCKGTKTEHFYECRNYCAFAILADMRNGYGFAGVDTGTGFVPISPPRGLPPDLDAMPDGLVDYGHDESWLTLRELLECDTEQITTRLGIVTKDEYLECKASTPMKRPRSYCGGIGGGGVVTVTAAMYEKGHTNCTHVQMEWKETYKEAAGRLFTVFVPALEALGPPDDVRIVFNFDS